MNIDDIRADFPVLDQEIEGRPVVYMDSSATSLKPQTVIDAVNGFYTGYTANIHRGVHRFSEQASDAFEDSRRKLARFIGADENEVVFTRGTTEGINMVCRSYPGIRKVIVTALEHTSNFLPWDQMEERLIVPVDAQGLLDMETLERYLADGADLLAVTHMSNALGAITPLEDIIPLAHQHGVKVLVDSAQGVPHLPVDVKALDVDFLACTAHKMCGPSGIGALYGKYELLQEMQPWLYGGDMVSELHMDSYIVQDPPHRFEAGTPPIEAAIGWGAAVDYLSAIGMQNVAAHDREIVSYALQRLGDINGVKINGPTDPTRRSASVSFNIDGLEAHGVARMLSNRANIMARSGFHCAQPLHEAMSMLPTVRTSFYLYNTKQEVDLLATTLESITRFL